MLGQVIIQPWDLYEIFTLDGITYLIAVVLISLIKYVPDKLFEIDKGSLVGRLKTGFRFLKNHKTLFVFGFFSHSIFVIMLVTLFTVMPMFIKNVLNAGGEVFGSMEMLYGLGALTAGIFIGKWTAKLPKIAVIITLIFSTTVLLMLCGFIYTIPYYLLTGIFVGFANAGIRILRVSYLFDHIPNKIIGRVNSVFSVLNIMMRVIFVSIFSLAFFAMSDNIVYAYFILAGFTLFSGMVLLRNYEKIKYL